MPILTPRQTQILQLTANGFCYAEIALMLGVSHQTVKNHLYDIGVRLNTSGRIESIFYAIAVDLIDFELARDCIKRRVDARLEARI